MNYKVLTTRNFEKEAKRLIKKFPSLKKELNDLNAELLANPQSGTSIGHHTFKVRLAVKSKGKGKSGGMRVITHIKLDFFVQNTSNIFLLSIYDKSESANINSEELKRLIQSIAR